MDATITSLDESNITPGLLWAGTGDGNVQVTRDAGRTWTNVRDTIPGHPGYWVSRVAPSFLRSDAPGDVKVRVFDGARLIAEVDGPKTAGVNSVRWNMQAHREAGPTDAAGGRGGFAGGGGRRGGAASTVPVFPAGAAGTVLSTVPPGEYRVVLSVGVRNTRRRPSSAPTIGRIADLSDLWCLKDFRGRSLLDVG